MLFSANSVEWNSKGDPKNSNIWFQDNMIATDLIEKTIALVMKPSVFVPYLIRFSFCYCT